MEKLIIFWSLFLTCAAATIYIVQDEDFVMDCYVLPSDPNAQSDFYIELMYSTQTQAVKTIARYKYNLKLVSGDVAEDSSSQFYGRISFTPANKFTLQRVQIQDEGNYSCIARGFYINPPQEMANEMIVYVPPIVEVKKMTDPLLVGTNPINAALCSAKNGKPRPQVSWSTERHLELNYTDSSQTGSPSATTTTVSTLYVAPTKFYNQQPFMCTVVHPALPNGQNTSVILLEVQYAPETPKITVLDEGTKLQCSSDGNPSPTIVWTLPAVAPSPSVVSDTVNIISPQNPERQNDTYTCTASNIIEPAAFTSITTGEASTIVSMVNQSNTGVIVGAVIGSIVLLVIIAVLIYWFVIRRSREKDEGPYPKRTLSHRDGENPWGQSSGGGRPTIEHANESLNKNRPPSPNDPPPEDDDNRGSESSHSDMEGDMEGHDVDVPLTGGYDDDMPTAGIVSKNSVNFQHRRQRPSTSPHRSSQKGGYPEPTPRSAPQSDPHYEVPPTDGYYEDEYDDEGAPLAEHHPNEEPMDDRFYDLPENRYPQRFQQPPQRVESLPPYTQDPIQYASIDHSYKDPNRPRTRPPYHEPVEYAEIRSHGQIV